jgi:hypothetical protein
MKLKEEQIALAERLNEAVFKLEHQKKLEEERKQLDNIKQIQQKPLPEKPRKVKVVPFKGMDARREERLQKREELMKLKKQKEEEQRMLKEAEEKKKIEHEKALKEDEERKRKIEEEQKQIVKAEQLKRKQFLTSKEQFVRGMILKRYYGLNPWIKFITRCKVEDLQAQVIYKTNLQSKAFSKLKTRTITKLNQRLEIMNETADYFRSKQLYNKLIDYRKAFYNHHDKLVKAIIFNKERLISKAYKSIIKANSNRRMKEEELIDKAQDLLGNVIKELTLRNAFNKLLSYTQVQKREKWHEERRKYLKSRISELLT